MTESEFMSEKIDNLTLEVRATKWLLAVGAGVIIGLYLARNK